MMSLDGGQLCQVIPCVILRHHRFRWLGYRGTEATPLGALLVFFSFQLAGAVLINNSVIAYVKNPHREWSVESQAILFGFKVPDLLHLQTSELVPFLYGILFRTLVDLDHK
jgi:hypothetical protein